jgi:hypothetical protein
MSEANINSPTSTATPMDLDFNQNDIEDNEDQGVGSKNTNSTTSEEDLSDPEDSSGDDSDNAKNKGYKLQGPARIQRKKDTRECRNRDNTRIAAIRNGNALPPQDNPNSYRIQIKFGTIIKHQKTQ